jgi:hypothetical protein
MNVDDNENIRVKITSSSLTLSPDNLNLVFNDTNCIFA